MSDERLPLVVFDLRRLMTLEGRILVHGEEETGRQSGRNYLLLEGTDGRVHYVYYTPEMEAVRNHGGLRANSFIRLRKLFSLEIDELGTPSPSCATSGFCEKPCNALSGAALFHRRTAGMDGSGATRRHLATRRPLWKANTSRKKLSATRTATMAAREVDRSCSLGRADWRPRGAAPNSATA
jgi:hypothetical protein